MDLAKVTIEQSEVEDRSDGTRPSLMSMPRNSAGMADTVSGGPGCPTHDIIGPGLRLAWAFEQDRRAENPTNLTRKWMRAEWLRYHLLLCDGKGNGFGTERVEGLTELATAEFSQLTVEESSTECRACQSKLRERQESDTVTPVVLSNQSNLELARCIICDACLSPAQMFRSCGFVGQLDLQVGDITLIGFVLGSYFRNRTLECWRFGRTILVEVRKRTRGPQHVGSAARESRNALSSLCLHLQKQTSQQST